MSRATRRRWGKREHRRFVRDRFTELCQLHDAGHSPETIASKLGLSLQDAHEVILLLEEADAKVAAREAS